MFCIEQEETVEGGAVVEEKELHQVSVEKVIDEYLTEKYPFARFICEKEIGVVIALSQEQTVNELLGVFDQIQKVCRQVFGFPSESEAGNSGSDRCRNRLWKQKRQVDTGQFRIWEV